MSFKEFADCESFAACNTDAGMVIPLGVADADSRATPFGIMHSEKNPVHIVEDIVTYSANMPRIVGDAR